jgi:muramoyltetrapeptide carboxypeptidase LdcA involved in peptidoglycan recycling
MKYSKPKRLKKGDTVALLSPSWWGPSIFPHIYESGIDVLQTLGLQVKEFPSARMDNDFLYNNPEFRARDINNAFKDKAVSAIFATIGWDDSVRILPFLDSETIKKNPKIFMWYSDTTTLHSYLNQLWLITFHWPSIMSWFSQRDALGVDFHQHIIDFLFWNYTSYCYPTFPFYTNGYPDRNNKTNVGKINASMQNDGRHRLQWNSLASGELFGGCIEVFEFMKSTDFRPQKDFRHNKVLFFETSEEKPSVNQVKYMLRNYWTQWVFGKISALLFWRAMKHSAEEKKELDECILQIVSNECNNKELVIVSNMDFWHADPQFILPLGIRAEVNPINKTFSLVESPFQ